MDVANDMCMGLKNDFASTNRAFNATVHENPIGFYAAANSGLGRNDDGATVHIPLDATIDLDQALGRNTSCDFQTFLNDGSSTSAPEKHGFLLRDTEIAFGQCKDPRSSS
jgi:hypothetical protein